MTLECFLVVHYCLDIQLFIEQGLRFLVIGYMKKLIALSQKVDTLLFKTAPETFKTVEAYNESFKNDSIKTSNATLDEI